jgi:aminopeptidase N
MTDVVRLHKYFQPNRYDLKLSPNKNNMTFRGTVKIGGQVMGAQTHLRLHAKGLQIDTVKINGQPAKFKLQKALDELQITLAADLTSQILNIDIQFGGAITKTLHGLYPTTSHNGEVALMTHFESHHAREVFPCIDEPAAKAVFSLTLKVPKDEIALSNTMPLMEKSFKNHTVVTFYDSPLMSTYLLAFVIGKFNKLESKCRDGTVIRAWVTGRQTKQTEFCLDVAKKTLEYFVDYFKYPYPLPKLDFVAVADFGAAAMENWGLITFRESCMLVDEQNTSLDAKQFVATVTAHEIAHMWFGDLVTMKWWNDLWLNEGFASWLEYLAVDHIFPQWHMWTQFLVAEQLPAMRLDALKNTHPIEVHIPSPDVIFTIFDNISYSKGACMIHMLHEYLGDNNFRSSLTAYLNKFAYKNSGTEDLWQILEEVSNKPVKQFMSAWTTQPGFPLLDVKKTNDKLIIKQSVFGRNQATDNQAVWPVPLVSSDIELATLTDSKMSVRLPKKLDTFKLNTGQPGFYITKYWSEHYRQLAQSVQNGKFSEVDRLSLLFDTLMLTKNGQLPLTHLVTLLTSYRNETGLPAWDSIALTIADIRRVMGPIVRQAIKPFLSDLTSAQLQRLGWKELQNDSYFDKLLRPLILSLADSADNALVIDEALSQFNLATNVEDLNKDLRAVILISVSRRGGQPEFDKMLTMLRTTTSSEDKMTLGAALTNFRNPKQYRQALNLIKTDEVRLQDAISWVAGSLANPAARYDTWSWLKRNWSWIKKNLGNDMGYSRLPIYAALYFSDNKFLADYRSFFQSVRETSLDRTIRQGIETVQLQTAWRQRDSEALLKWLEKY